MTGAFDWGNEGKGVSPGKADKLPRHIERMNEGTRPPEMKNGSGGGSNLPWGGKPAEQKKAYMQGEPKNKGSMMSKTGATKGVSSLPQSNGKSMQGRSQTQPSKSVPSATPKKGKK